MGEVCFSGSEFPTENVFVVAHVEWREGWLQKALSFRNHFLERTLYSQADHQLNAPVQRTFFSFFFISGINCIHVGPPTGVFIAGLTAAIRFDCWLRFLLIPNVVMFYNCLISGQLTHFYLMHFCLLLCFLSLSSIHQHPEEEGVGEDRFVIFFFLLLVIPDVSEHSCV